MQTEPLTLLLLVLVAAGVWAVVELALTIRKARTSVDQITRSANETIEQVQPIIAKADGVMDEIQPALKRVDPLMEQAGVVVDEATISLDKVNAILTDVSSVSGTAANVTTAVDQVATNAASGVNDVINRLRGKAPEGTARIAAGREEAPVAQDAPQEAAPKHAVPQDDNYITYGDPAPKDED